MVEEKKPTRDVKFDGLRLIGLFAIILAHVNPPALLFQLRNFDVPLMVLVSGAVYGLSKSSKKNYFSYIGGRVARVLLPTWAFLVLFFLLIPIFGLHFSKQTILGSFLLLNGIGYVWIIRVFILVALIAPFFIFLYNKIQRKTLYLLSLFILFIFYVFLYAIYPFFHLKGFIDGFFQNIIFYLLPFGTVAGLGIYLLHASKKAIYVLLLATSIVCLCLAFFNSFSPTQNFKYPPQAYYISYAIVISLFLYSISFTKIFLQVFRIPLFQFMSLSSLWIYLWQIFFLFLWPTMQQFIPKVMNNFVGEFFMIMALSTLVTYLQKIILGKFVGKIPFDRLASFLIIVFLK